MSTTTKERVYAKEWVCKDGCGNTYSSPLPISAYAHNCSKKGGANVDSIPVQDSLNSPSNSDEKRVASLSTEAPMSEEDTEMATRAEPKVQTAKAEKTKATPKTKATAPAAAEGEKKGRRNMGGRGWLASEVEKILRKRSTETVSVGEIVKAITNRDGEHPSTGAVAAVILRWGEAGYIKVKQERPMSFNGFQTKWKDSNLEAFLDAEKAKRAKARAAAKA